MLDKFNECPLQILGYIQTVNGSSIDIDRRIGAFFTPICYALWCTHDLSISTYNDIQLYFHFQSRVGNHRSQTHTRCDQYRWKAVVFPEMEIVLMTYLSLAAPRVAKIIMSIFPFQYLLIMLLIHQIVYPYHKSNNALDTCPTMHHFVTEMCTHVHISVTKWCNMGYCLMHCGIWEKDLLLRHHAKGQDYFKLRTIIIYILFHYKLQWVPCVMGKWCTVLANTL